MANDGVTNWKAVSPAHRKRISAIVNHYAKQKHPFAACVRDNRKRFGPRTEQVCAVVKDMGRRSTKWRKGGHKSLAAPRGGVVDLSRFEVDYVQVRADLIALADELEEMERR